MEETPFETISAEVQLAWNEMSAKWQKETTWPTLEEATTAYSTALQDHESASFLIQDLEVQIEDLEAQLKRLNRDMPEYQRKNQADIIRDQIAGKQAEILSCEDRVVLLEQRVQRQCEFYQHLLVVHNRKLFKERFPARECPRRQSQCEGLLDALQELEDEDENIDMGASEDTEQDD